MTSDGVILAKSNQEQAVAAWVNYLNQLRIDNLLDALRQQDVNLTDALASIDWAMEKARSLIAINRGSWRGLHGFLAEVAEVGVGNARSQILGEGAPYRWVDDNSYADLIRSGVEIQQKFYASYRADLLAIAKHLQDYPDFVRNGGKYQVPADHFKAIQELNEMPLDEAGKFLTRSGGGPSFTDWQWVRRFLGEGPVGIESLEPSNLDYNEVQKGAIDSTLEAEKGTIHATDQHLREAALKKGMPTLQEGAKATLAAATIEGGTTFVLAVVAKRRKGRKLKEFTSEDWIDIAGDTSFGFVQGGARGLSIYALTNLTATSAAVASSIVTAAFGIAEQANKLRRGEIDELEFIQNAEIVSLDAAVSALSSFVGQALIPVPVLGAVIGNTVGTVMYKAASSSLSKREAELIAGYLEEQRALDHQLSTEHQELIEKLEASMSDYLDVLERAFSPNVETAFLGSVELALELGVTSEEVLDSEEKVLAYFLD